jgi:2-succinyl-6-hydroxy-2,4-cyclohexadiene-1-carboxylate synthase
VSSSVIFNVQYKIFNRFMLHYRTIGTQDAPPVLFLHGFLGAAGDWNASIAALGDRFRCISVDLPGHGESVDLADEAYTFPGCASAIIETLDQLQIEQCSVVGYSMGGRVALYLANKFPERITKLVLESSSPGLRTPAERAARRDHDEQLAHELETKPLSRFLRRWYAQPLFRTLAADEERLQRIITQRCQNDSLELARSLRGLGTGRQPSLWEQLPTIGLLMLLVVGEHDAKFRTIAHEMQALQRQARIAVVPNAGHNVHEEQGNAFTEIVRAFLAEAP